MDKAIDAEKTQKLFNHFKNNLELFRESTAVVYINYKKFTMPVRPGLGPLEVKHHKVHEVISREDMLDIIAKKSEEAFPGLSKTYYKDFSKDILKTAENHFSHQAKTVRKKSPIGYIMSKYGKILPHEMRNFDSKIEVMIIGEILTPRW